MNIQLRRYLNGQWSNSEQDIVTIEEPLEIRVQGRPTAVTMRTPGHDIELVLGFLCTEGVIDGRDDVYAIAHVDDPSDVQRNTVDAVLSGGVPMARTHKADRRLFATSSCGICGKESIDRIIQTGLTVEPIAMPDPSLICNLPEALRSAQNAFAQTGGIHAAGLFTLDGNCLVVREDVGRHNAVDKVIGYALENDIFPCRKAILVLSGRAGFELIQKAAMAQIPLVVAIGAPSSLAVTLAQQLGMGLIGFTKSNRFNVYSESKNVS
ncbi:MAG: formate dehydrogenase accessory sulfurtransferase FdhD [Myxococcota bacterium]|nr:formate dehydrogenase accessory sulfurtransferase FdhD [Myxococcota bacterium]MEC8379671.1 formate dehydrogenase accessory sulfurtransferase FdhD [Myxococcota bacterium]